MQTLQGCVLNKIGGGMKNGSPGTGNKWVMDPNQQVHLQVGPVIYDGPASGLANGWQALKQEAVSAGWTAAQGLVLVEAGVACDFYSDWSVCTDAQQQVDFIMDQPNN